MSILLRFPTDLICALVSEWLRLKDVSLLDKAYCNKEERPDLLEFVFKSPGCVVRHFSHTKEGTLRMGWLNCRKLHVRDLFISSTTLNDCLVYLQNCGESVCSIKLNEIDMSSPMCQHLLTEVSLHCNNLASMACRSCNINESIVDIFRSCAKLKSLVLSNCTDGFNRFYNSVDSRPLFIQAMTAKLDVLRASLTVLRAIQLSISLRHLRRLYVVCGHDNERSGMQKLLLQSEIKGENIRSLGLKIIYGASDSSITGAISLCPNILHLDISMCRNLTDMTLDFIARQLTQLRTINVSNCNFTDAGLAALAHHRKDTLQGLFASECSKLTGAGFNALLQHCSHLHTIGSNLVPQITGTLNPQLLSNIRTLQTDSKYNDTIEHMLQYFTRLENMYIGCYNGRLLILPDNSAPALRNLILGIANSYGHSNDIAFGYASCLWSQHQDATVAALQAQRPRLHVRFESGNDWPSNLTKLPV